MAKWDIQDGFRWLQCRDGDEYNFAYVLPQAPGAPVMLVIPTSLQMRWVESPPFFCATSETAWDVSSQYIETPVGLLPLHKFESLSTNGQEKFKGLTGGVGEIKISSRGICQ